MLTRTLAAALLATTMLAGAAVAQTNNSTTGNAPMTGSATTATTDLSGQWRASKLMGVDIYGPNNEKVGDVSELLLDQNGMVQSVVVGVGGFLGMGEKSVAIPMKEIKWSNEPMRTAAASSGSGAGMNSGTGAGGAGATETTGSTAAAPENSGARSASTPANRMYPDHGMISMTRDQLKSAPDTKYP